MRKPLLALTMGDPAGVGPEIVVRACGDPAVGQYCTPLVVGHMETLRRAVAASGGGLAVTAVKAVAEARTVGNGLACWHVGSDEVLEAPRAQVDARCGRAAYEAVVAATRLALAGDVDGVVTAPLNKKALFAAGLSYPGHTELLAELCGVEQFAMMLYLGSGSTVKGPCGLGIAHATLHVALRDVPARLCAAAIVEKVRLCHDVMRRFGVVKPRIGVAALNPHAGEHGLFGDEELRIIAPAVEQACDMGFCVTGPVAADALMVRAAGGEFDAVVAMYHDQGHIALKLLDMFKAVNITLGLPIVRTSVAHGTAFDLVGRASPTITSMVEAVRVAALMARTRRMVHEIGNPS